MPFTAGSSVTKLTIPPIPGTMSILTVKLLVMDQESTHEKWICQQGVISERPYLLHNNDKAYVPHLIKSPRNNFATKDIECCIDGEVRVAKWWHLKKMYTLDSS